MITFIAGIVVGWAVLALGVGILVGKAIANAPKPLPLRPDVAPEAELYVPSEWVA